MYEVVEVTQKQDLHAASLKPELPRYATRFGRSDLPDDLQTSFIQPPCSLFTLCFHRVLIYGLAESSQHLHPPHDLKMAAPVASGSHAPNREEEQKRILTADLLVRRHLELARLDRSKNDDHD
jgi:hypothetical protein